MISGVGRLRAEAWFWAMLSVSRCALLLDFEVPHSSQEAAMNGPPRLLVGRENRQVKEAGRL